ncbi:MAG TPA: hypothetical protein VH107_15530 [Lacipirellulaceae bacterium]|jgi:hypothetical protein|nr:hypothetical protein [Lacipirellulaceae bacterium]
MAGNLKGQGGIKGLLLQHGEKAAIALVGFIALWLIYKTTTLPRLEEKFKAAKLHSEITETSSAVQNAQWPEPGSEQASEVRPFTPITEKADISVNPAAYKVSDTALNPRVVAPTILRTDPTLLNATDVRATGGSGLFAFVDEAIRKAREQKLALEEQERQKKEADRAAKDAKAGAEGGPGAAGRRKTGPEGSSNEPYDPAHPKRRRLEGMTRALGVPLQGGERIEAAYWACVVAKVPIREQLKLYQDAFEKAKGGFDPARDFPQYKGYFVQRAEVIPDKELEWKAVPVYDGQHTSVVSDTPLNRVAMGGAVMEKLLANAAKFWAGMSPDVIDPRFSDYILTFPLPPLVGRDWGPEADHPDIPLLANTPPLEQELPPEAIPAGGTEKPAGADNAFGSANPNGATSGPPIGGRPGGFAMGPGFGRGSMLGGPPVGGRSGPGMPPGGGEGRSYAAAGPGAGNGRSSLPKGVDNLLFRFFDFTVEPGKKYKYRVKLVLSDANYNATDNTVAPAVLDRHRQESQAARTKNPTGIRPDIRMVENWSDPSPTVGIPLSGGVKLVDVKVPSADKVNDEPSANLLVNSFDVDATDKNNAIQAANKKDFRRGGVANMTEKADYLVDGGLAIDTDDNFKFVTGMTLVDIDGGKKLANSQTSPGRVLMMGPAGELYVHNELDDKPAVDYHKAIFEEHRSPDGGPEGPGGRGSNRGRPSGRR